MRCASCGARAADGARFCDRCGSPINATVTTDSTDATDRSVRPDPSDRIGQPGKPPAEAPGDRRVVTALFADLVDYVRMIAEHDPEEVRARVTAALATMGDAIERFDGTREKFIGDAVFAVFGWPRGHDDDAVRASLAAMAIRAGLHDVADGGEPHGGPHRDRDR